MLLASNNTNLLSKMCVIIIYVIIRTISFSAVPENFEKCTEIYLFSDAMSGL